MPAPTFWTDVESLVASSAVVIDRAQGSRHPRHPEHVYPLDYGYISGTVSGDGQGIDVWLGSSGRRHVTATITTIDLLKRDLETKLLLGCSPDEISRIETFFAQLGIRCVVQVRQLPSI